MNQYATSQVANAWRRWERDVEKMWIKRKLYKQHGSLQSSDLRRAVARVIDKNGHDMIFWHGQDDYNIYI